jgi:maleylacetoacetate isomerase
MLTLYNYWRSSAAYRVRIGLNLKRVGYESVPVNLAPGVEEQLGGAYLKINPHARVPALETPNGVLTQSLAILNWLDDTYPDPPFLPATPWVRAQVREFALAIACDIHPLNNSGAVRRLQAQFDASQEDIIAWSQHWIALTFDALEARLAARAAHAFCFGANPSLADICLIPQCTNARRMHVDLSRYPRINAIDLYARGQPAFAAAEPDLQSDAPCR